MNQPLGASGSTAVVPLALALMLVASVLHAQGSASSDDIGTAQQEISAERSWGHVYFVEGTFGATVGGGESEFYLGVGIFGGRGAIVGPLGAGVALMEFIHPPGTDGDSWASLVPPLYVHIIPYVQWLEPAYGSQRPRPGAVIDIYLGGSPVAALSEKVTDPETGETDFDYDWWWHWFARAGVAITVGDAAPLGIDAGIVWHDFDSASDDAGVCKYVALRYALGGNESRYR